MEDNKENSEHSIAQDASKSTENKTATIENESIKTSTIENKKNQDINIKNKINVPKIKFNFSSIKNVYENQYKKLLIIPFLILFLAFVQIGYQLAATGDFIHRDVSLKGGVTVTIPTEQEIDILTLENAVSLEFPNNDVAVKSISQFGSQSGIIVEAGISQEEANNLVDAIKKNIGKELNENEYSVEIVGSSLGASFFKETISALGIAFVFMAIVVFLYFRTFVPSAAVILAAFSNMAVTLAVVNILGVKISAAGIAAVLMLIGYSVDTDILLSTRVLKRKEGTEMERVYGAIRTGIMMTSTTLAAVTIGLIFTQSEVIRQIMIILFIGLLTDLINTWIQNVGILRLYLEKKAKRAAQ
ncbi:protein translocase subunit SecF [Candidatus Woesearchaeota archaeon]|nr:protein translocase subunit SecF [Candidatus Woesearchaeota archaeon]